MKPESNSLMDRPTGEAPPPVPREDLRRGEQGTAVEALQQALVRLGYLSAQDLQGAEGLFGPKTEAALKSFQTSESLAGDGLYGQSTREALARRLELAAPSRPGPAEEGTGGVSAAQLRAIMPRLKQSAELYLPFLNAAMAEVEINTPRRQAAFLAQLAHESCEFRYFEELASGEAYEGRANLGNVIKGDGVRYKGRGPIQLTGRRNYQLAGKALGLDLEASPQQAASPEVGFRVAGWFWKTHRLNQLADADRFDDITRIINGGYNGKAEREAYYRRALGVLGR
jgi:predicted chitinase